MQAVMDFIHNPVAPIILAGVIVVLVAAVSFVVRSLKSSHTQSEVPPSTSVVPEASLPQAQESEVEGAQRSRDGPAAQTADHAAPSSGQVSTPEETPASGIEEERTESASIEIPESIPSRMGRLRARLARSGALGKSLLSLLSRGDLSAADWEEMEDSLLVADLGLEATDELMEALHTRVKVENTSDPQVVRALLREELLKLVDPDMDRSVNLAVRDVDGVQVPATILMVGVNGTGKTTTTGKWHAFSAPKDMRSCWGLPIPSALLQLNSLRPGEVALALMLSVLIVKVLTRRPLHLNRLKKVFDEAVMLSWSIPRAVFRQSLLSWTSWVRSSA